MNKTIPTELESTLIACVKTKMMANDTFLKMTEYERLEFLSRIDTFAFIQDMLKSKTMEELGEDIEIKRMLYGTEEAFKKEMGECQQLLAILEKE